MLGSIVVGDNSVFFALYNAVIYTQDIFGAGSDTSSHIGPVGLVRANEEPRSDAQSTNRASEYPSREADGK